MTSPSYPGETAGTDVTVTFTRSGGCTAGTWALVGTYSFEVTSLSVTGSKATCTVSIPGDTADGTSLTVTARYTDGTTETPTNTATATATITVGEPLVFNLPARLEVQNYAEAQNFPLNRYVSGAAHPFSIVEDPNNPLPANTDISGTSNPSTGRQGDFRLLAGNVTADRTVHLRCRDAAGRTDDDAVVIGIRAYGCTQANRVVPIDGDGRIGFYLHGRKSLNEPLTLDVPQASTSIVRIGSAAGTVYDAVLNALQDSPINVGRTFNFTANIINVTTRAVRGTCSGSYQVVPTFTVDRNIAVQRGRSVNLPIVFDPQLSGEDLSNVRVSLRGPQWATAAGNVITLSPGPHERTENYILYVSAVSPDGFQYYSEDGSAEIAIAVTVTAGPPMSISCASPSIGVSSLSNQLDVTVTLGSVSNPDGPVQWTASARGIVADASLPQLRFTRLILAGLWALMVNAEEFRRVVPFVLTATDRNVTVQCNGSITFLRAE